MALRPEFREALTLVVRAVAAMEARDLQPPILVGGAAVELYTQGAVLSGDFDLITSNQQALFEELAKLGFEPPNATTPARSMIHRRLGFAVEAVSGPLMDGKADVGRVVAIGVGRETIPVIPIEDLIADRMAQALSPPFGGLRQDMKDQSVKLRLLADPPDEAYLDRRIREETGDEASLATLEGWIDEDRKAGGS